MLFSVVPTEKTRGNGQKFKHVKCHLNLKKKITNFFIVRVVKHWTKLPRELVEVSLDIFNT